jgi:hypothetical protein
MPHSNAMTRHQLLLDELHRTLQEHDQARMDMQEIIVHINATPQKEHSSTCDKCNALSLKLQSHQTALRRFRLNLTRAIGAHYRNK